MGLICSTCGVDNRDSAQRCKGCGTSLETGACPGCGALRKPNARFCGECGKPLEASANSGVITPLVPVLPSPPPPTPTPTPTPNLMGQATEQSVASVSRKSTTGQRVAVVIAAVAGLAAIGGAVWTMMARSDAPEIVSQAPAVVPPVAAVPIVTPPVQAPPPPVPVPAPEPAPVPAPAPVPVPVPAPPAVKAPTERPAQATPKPQARPAPAPKTEPPLPPLRFIPMNPAPAPAPAPAPVPAPVPAAPAPLAGADRVRAALRQCDGESNLFTKGFCVVKVRQLNCGDLWGKIPDCPLTKQNDSPNN